MLTTANGEPLHLLRTKLYRPRPTGELVHRSRLHEALDRYRDRSITLISAPAGFGKTTVLTDWLERCSSPSAWLSLDRSDGDLSVFLSYFIAAIRTVFPATCADTLAILQAPVLPPVASLVTALANDLDHLADEPALQAGGRFILVLDDYHLVRDPAVHSLMTELLRHPPRTMHLVVSARQDPPFLEHGLRARGDFSEIRIGELRFTPDEATSFLQQALEMQLEAKTLAELVDSNEGWGTGLRLTALTLKAGSELRGPEATSYNRYTSDYLAAEVLSRVPIPTQDFLLKSSILDHLTGSLCDALVPPADPEWDGSAYLRWLATENVFTFSLDAQGRWYRYHHLFQRLLQAELERRCSKWEIVDLHSRAAKWFAEHGLIQEAIQHALAAGDESLAAQLVGQHGHEAIHREHWRQIEQWLGMLPRRLIDARPELLLLEAWIVQNQWRFNDLPGYLDRIEVLIEQEPPGEPDRTRLLGEVDALRSLAWYYHLDWGRSFACAEHALAALPMQCSTARGVAWLYFANGCLMAGDAQGAIDALHEALKEDRFHGNSFPTRPYMGLCQLYWMQGDLVNLFLAGTQMLQVAQQRDLVEAASWAHYFRGCALYQQNDLAGAREEFAVTVRLRYAGHAYPFSQSAFGLVLTLAGLGEFDEACSVLDSAAAYGLEMNNRRVITDAEAVRACLARRTGAVAEAHRWAARFNPDTPLVPLTTFAVPHIIRARVLVADGSPESLEEAARALARLHELAASTHNARYLSEILALEALIQDGKGDRRAAFDTLGQAMDLAEPGGLIRVFADLGPKMGTLLAQLVERGGASEYRKRVLAAFQDDGAAQQSASQAPTSQPVSPPSLPSSNGLIEPLSRRELDVLLLLSERLTDKEIARELFLSPQTVKRHASNIYQKLDVANRRDAVARATALGVLPPSPPGQRRPPPPR